MRAETRLSLSAFGVLCAGFLGGPVAAQCESAKTSTVPDEPNFLALEGEWAFVGDLGTAGGQTGIVAVYRKSGRNWFRTQELRPSLDTDPFDSFVGNSDMALSGSRLLIGASDAFNVIGQGGGDPPDPMDPGTPTGAAYLFELQGDQWVQTQRFDGVGAPGEVPTFNYGSTVDIDGDRIVIEGDGIEVFDFQGGQWVQTDAIAGFGDELAVSGDRVLALRFGGGYMYELQSGVWQETAFFPGIGEGDIALDGQTAALSGGPGEVTIYGLEGSTWVEEDTVGFPFSLERFAASMALQEDYLLVGAPFNGRCQDDSIIGKGSASLYRRTPFAWELVERLEASDGADCGHFGASVALDGDVVMVGTSPFRGFDFPMEYAIYTYSIAETECATLTVDNGIPGKTDALISLGNGGVQIMTLSPGAEFAGKTYWVLGSTSGSSPGFPFGGFRVPLNMDAYFTNTLVNANRGLFTNNLGFLDGAGEATVVLTVPAGSDPALIEMLLFHSFGIFDPGFVPLHVSNVVDVTLGP